MPCGGAIWLRAEVQAEGLGAKESLVVAVSADGVGGRCALYLGSGGKLKATSVPGGQSASKNVAGAESMDAGDEDACGSRLTWVRAAPQRER